MIVLQQVGKKLSTKEMRALKGGYESQFLPGCASATGHMIQLMICQSDEECPRLDLFCCGERVPGSCGLTYCEYVNFICGWSLRLSGTAFLSPKFLAAFDA
jgi:hypothetical protein